MWFTVGETSPRNPAGHAKFLNFDLCRFRKLVKARETQTEISIRHVQTQEKGPPCSLRSSRHSYEVDFPACNVQNILYLLPNLLMTHAPPLPSTPGIYRQAPLAALPPTHILPLPALSGPLCLKFSPCGREGVNNRVLTYLCVGLFLPRDKAVVKGKAKEEGCRGKAQERSCDGREIGRKNVSLISTTFQPHCF